MTATGMRAIEAHAKRFCVTATVRNGLIYVDAVRSNGQRWAGYIGLRKGASIEAQKRHIEAKIKRLQAPQ